MKAVVQRVKNCSVIIHGKTNSSIGAGILIFLGIHEDDQENDANLLADKCAQLRIFPDADGKMNLSVKDTGGSAMVVSQFTLYGDTRKGNRPNYMRAAKPELAEHLYSCFVGRLRFSLGHERVETGVFREMMDVELVNDGPVTILIETKNMEMEP